MGMATEKWTVSAVAVALGLLTITTIQGAEPVRVLGVIVVAAVAALVVGGLVGALEMYLRDDREQDAET